MTMQQNDDVCLNPDSAWGKHYVSRQVWKKLCRKCGFSETSVPKYISNGAEQTTYDFGPKYVLKISDRDFIVKTGKKLNRKRIPMVAKCLAIVKANDRPNDGFYCIIQERCKPMESSGSTGDFHQLASLMQEFRKKGVSPDMIIAAAQLNKLGAQYLCDLHSANMMFDSKNTLVISDYGCLRF